MRTIKKLTGKQHVLIAAGMILLAGCGDPGSRALLQGRKLLGKERYPQAIEKLRAASQLLTNNANAYNDLGLACHYGGLPTDAEKAYRRAIALDPDLTEAHYNLGCLYLDEKDYEKAKAELTAYTLRRGNAIEGFLKLGTAQLRAGQSATGQKRQNEFSTAERTFGDALRLAPQNPEALTGAGLARLQRGRADEAARYFESALKYQPNYAPALLNLAVVQQLYFKDRPGALRNYRAYIALKPPPPDLESVQSVVAELEGQADAPATRPPSQIQPTVTPSRTSLAETPAPVRVAPAKAPVAASNPPSQGIVATPVSPPRPERVIVAPEPVLKAAQEPTVSPAPVTAAAPAPAPSATAPMTPAAPEKRGFFARLNPLNLFAKNKSAGEADSGQGDPGGGASAPGAGRYAYKNPPLPVPGQRNPAERAFAQGIQAYQSHRLPEAIQAYRRAAQLDPAFFEASYNLALAASEAGSTTLALSAYETALAIRPQSLDARYNFALLLRQAGYPLDAAAELEKLIANNPNESRAHLALGNLYAQQLSRSDKARYHYLKVLEIDPRNPQAAAIRSWLTEKQR